MRVLLPSGQCVLALFERLGTRMDVINLGCLVDVQRGLGPRSTARRRGAEKLLEAMGSGSEFHARSTDRIPGGALASMFGDWRRMRVGVVGGSQPFSARAP